MQSHQTRGNALRGDLARWRNLDAIAVLLVLAEHVKEDRSFQAVRSTGTKRLHVSAADADWEFLVYGPKFYDTRARKGGGGAVDLVMHLWRAPFRKAVQILQAKGL